MLDFITTIMKGIFPGNEADTIKQDNESLRDLVNNLTNLALAITEDRKEINNTVNNNNTINSKEKEDVDDLEVDVLSGLCLDEPDSISSPGEAAPNFSR